MKLFSGVPPDPSEEDSDVLDEMAELFNNKGQYLATLFSFSMNGRLQKLGEGVNAKVFPMKLFLHQSYLSEWSHQF